MGKLRYNGTEQDFYLLQRLYANFPPITSIEDFVFTCRAYCYSTDVEIYITNDMLREEDEKVPILSLKVRKERK